MTTITRIRTDYDARLHVEIDTDAKVLDAFLVTLPPYTSELGVLVHRKGVDMNDLWKDALAVVAHLRAQPWKEVHPPHVFQPFGVITARNFEGVRREAELRMSMMIGDGEPLEELAQRYPLDDVKQFHEERVTALCRALDLLNGAPLIATIPWPAFKGLN